ncbi:MAG TPA: hypothetical protein VN636_16630, partial [Acidimicrobiia bacterium]|nr:hypothetical protein [Acidimicrobiia bacterium]
MVVAAFLRLVAGIKIRRRWRSYAGVAVLLGLTAGTALLAVSGARRTQSSYSRFLRSVNASTMSVTSTGGVDAEAEARIAASPRVVQSRAWVGISVFVARDGKPTLTSQEIQTDGTFDGEYFEQDRFTATKGRL